MLPAFLLFLVTTMAAGARADWMTVGGPGDGKLQLSGPSGVAVDSGGRIYVADQGNSRVVRMDDMTGAGWAVFGDMGSGEKQLYLPGGVTVGADGRVYVADTRNARVAAFRWP